MDVTRERLLALPKAELHVHLDGSLRPATLIELAQEQGRPLPARDPAELARWIGGAAGDLVSYLGRFDLTLSVMQSAPAIERIAYELAVDNARENVRWLEVRFCPLLDTREGLTAAEAVEACLRGLARAEAELGIRSAVILCGLRHLDPTTTLDLAEIAIEHRARGVVALDLAGPERGHPARLHRDAFVAVVDHDMAVTIHAGEADGPASIREALRPCRANRIGHGTRLHEDRGLMRYVRDFRVPLEVCLTSNVQTGAAPSYEAHPARLYLDEGLVVTLATDNRLMSGTTLTDEYEHAHRHLGCSWEELAELARMGFRSAFLPWDEKGALLERVEGEIAAIR